MSTGRNVFKIKVKCKYNQLKNQCIVRKKNGIINIFTGYPTDFQVAADIRNTEQCTIHINKVASSIQFYTFI